MKTIITTLVTLCCALEMTATAEPADAGKQDVLQTLAKVAFMGQAVSNELTRISSAETIPTELRRLASNAVRHHDNAATNSYEQLNAFITTWTITNEPPVSSSTILLMKRTLEYSKSAVVQLDALTQNTNYPAPYRDAAARILSTVRGDNQRK